jgi:threonylcarbamoyladenosine tRNA methylthiotransferase MtaB
MLKIQNGCRHHCTYCIVPRARGPEESMPEDVLRRRVTAFRDAGVRELVLTGIQLGAWGTDLPGRPSLGDAVRLAADAFAPGRIRLSSVEPWSVDESLVRAVADNPRVCPHFHIPLQSGDDGVLRDMGRGYTASAYLEKLALIRASIPGAAIGTDVLCGFPTESEDAFDNTLAVMRAAAFSHVHGFSYSKRPGTRATALYGAGDRTSARRRVQRVRALGEALAADFLATQVGRCCDVLVEESGRGLTDTFVSVRVDGAPQGALIPCRLKIDEGARDRLWADHRDL